jgi:DMSO/TMAO reductase YedYZ heme-binding membrane subunit
MLAIDLKKWLWIITIPALLILLALGFFQAGEPAGFSAITGTILLTCTFVPGALLRLGLLKENAYVRWLVKYRKDLGIVAGTWLLTHGLVSGLFFLERDQPILDQLLSAPLRPVWVMVPIMALMLITSNQYSEKKLGRTWKNLHSLVWLLPGLMVLHGNLSIAQFEKEEFAPATLLLGLIALVAFCEYWKTRSYKRVLLLLAGAMIAVIFLLTNPMGN